MKLAIALLGLIPFSVLANTPASSQPVKLERGIEVTYVTKGKGAVPKREQTVEVHYRGVLDNGQEFDSSYKRGQTISFPLNQVIPCWTIGVSSIPVGSKVKLRCPSNTAYGPNGVPGAIPPNANLTFDIELVSIK